jgi:serine/threonine protein phosphatase PrpC
MVPDDMIAAVLGRPAPPQEQARALVEVALRRGGKDNVTAVVAHYALVTGGRS